MARADFPLSADGFCPKCGEHAPEPMIGYNASYDVIICSCPTCGYWRQHPPLDARPAHECAG